MIDQSMNIQKEEIHGINQIQEQMNKDDSDDVDQKVQMM